MSANQGSENTNMSGNAMKAHGTKKPKVPVYKKYAGTGVQDWLDPSTKLKPSDLEKPSLDVSAEDYPLIIEFNNLKDNSSQVHSTVSIDTPLFQPAPKVVIFEDYAPFATHEKKLFFRNNDSVARRIKLVQPESAFFEMSAPRLTSGEPLRSSAIAAGMEIYFMVRFKPQEVRDYTWDLVCSTEREKFLVPIRAVGVRPRITFPDSVDFGFCPVKSAMRKVLLVQNVGSAVAQFSMRSMNKQFSCPGEEMSVEPGGSQMIELFFTPPTGDPVDGEYEVEFFKGPKCYIQASGAGKNVQVSLSTPSVALEPSYISLTSQSIVRIKNMSEIPINFKWKSFSRESEEESERSRLLVEVERMEEIERNSLMQRIQEGFYNTVSLEDTVGSIAADDDEVDESGIPFGARAEEASLVRKYRNLKRALEVDNMLFVDDIFDVSPSEGQVWANSELEITVSFRPDTAAQYSCFSYLDVSGREDRMPLNMAGQGIGPHATLSFDVLDVGDVFINDEQHYQVSIINKGDISAQWHFESSLTKFGNKFSFNPKEGQLAPGDSQVLDIVFESDVLGEFSENFRFALQGNEDMLVCQIKGHVVGPTFHFDCSNIDFGVVSYDYLHESKMRLVNSSKIAMVFNLHVPQDGTYLKKEFNVEPCEGTLAPGQHMDILLEFIPSSVKVYDYSLVVDVFGVGDVLLSIPISAECIISPVQLNNREIDFGECFIRYPYEKQISLSNISDIVHTKFEVLPQQNYTKSTATFEAEPAIAVIEPNDSMEVTIRVVAEKLGSFKIPVLIQTAGSQEPPQQAVLMFSVVGPKVIVDQPDVRWGNVECLKDSERIVKITNDSLIMATMKLFLKQARSKFDLAARELTLEPKESYDLKITANLDDSVLCKEEVHIIVEESDNVMIPLSAKGVGTTMFCGTDLSTLDMGVQLTNTHFEKRIILENKGRRPQYLRWVNKTIEDDNAIRAEKAKELGKDAAQRLPKNLLPREPYFTVALEEITLRPRTATTFVFKGKVDVPGLVSEKFVLESRVGKERVMKPIVDCNVTCEVVNPLLQFSVPSMDYVYRWERGVEPTVQQREIILTNASAVPLSFFMKTEVPFNLSSFEHTLQPGEATDLLVDFDPLYQDNKQSHLVESQLAVAYRGHPQKDNLALTGDIIFPNLDFDSKTVNFGCILNDSKKTIKVKLTNPSKVVVTYDWTFLEEGLAAKVPGHKGNSDHHKFSAGQLVDILPINSVLQPGESEFVEFSMFGQANAKFNGHMLCVVEGGPEYKLSVQGEASQMAYALDTSTVDFGKVVYTEHADQEFSIKNTGKVPFPFRIEPGIAADVIEVLPATGNINAGESLSIKLVIHPGLPQATVDTLNVHIAHFDPVEIKCYCQGIFPTAAIGLPRYRKTGPYNETEGAMQSLWADFVGLATSNLNSPDESRLAPAEDQYLPPASGNSAAVSEFVMPLPPPRVDLDAESVASMNSMVTVKAPPQLMLEVEMTRLAMCKLLKDKLLEVDERLAREAEEARNAPVVEEEPDKKKGKGKKDTKKKTSALVAEDTLFCGTQRKIAEQVMMNEIVAASYVCEFGNVILGSTKKKAFKVTNASMIGVMNWNFDTTKLAQQGFSIEPFKAQKLVEGDSLDFVVKFTARSSGKLGKKQSILPLENKGSPTLNVVMQATVCLPDVEVSMENIDMESILIGQTKKVYVRLHNTTPVTSSWAFKKQASKDDKCVTITPSEGVLRAGKKCIVCVEFTPTNSGKVAVDFSLKVDNNNQKKTMLSVVGEGLGVVCKWDTPMMELGPIIPFTDGDERVVTLTNQSEFPVEVYSLDFDGTYKAEEDMLGQLDVYDRENNYRCPIREAGAPLCDEVHETFAELKKRQEEEAAKEAVQKASEERAAKIAAGEEVEEAEQADTEASVAGGGGSISGGSIVPVDIFDITPVRSGAAPRDEGLHQDVIVFGPPLMGVTSVANQLAKTLQLNVGRFDAILSEVALMDGPLGSTARRCTNTMSEGEAAKIAKEEGTLKEAADTSIADAEAAFTADKKNKGKEITDEERNTEAAQAYNAFVAGGTLSAETVAQILTYRMSWQDTGYGFVLDGLVSDFVGEEALLKGIEIALPKAVIANITMQGGSEVYEQRISALYADKKHEVKHLRKAIQHALKERDKLLKAMATKPSKGKKGAAATAMLTMQPTMGSTEIVVALPTGDESWVMQDHGPLYGTVIELDPQGIKSLEDHQKMPYYKQLLYSQDCQLKSSREVVAKIERIWTSERGLLDPKVLAAEAVEKEAQAAKEAEEIAAATAAIAVEEEKAAEGGEEKVSTDKTEKAGGELEGLESPFDAEADSAGAEGVDEMKSADELVSRPASATSVPDRYEEPLKLPRAVFYCDYAETVLPLVAAAFTTKEPVGSEEGTSEEGEKKEEEPPVTEATAGDTSAEIGDAEATPEVVDSGVFEIALEGDEDFDSSYNTVAALLPAAKVPPEDKDKVPDTTVQQLIRKPYARVDRKSVGCFTLYREDPIDPEEAERLAAEKAAAEEAAAAAAAAAAKAKKGAVVEEVVEVIEEPKTSYRWIIQGGESVTMKIKFASKVAGKFDASLGFEVMGTLQAFNLYTQGFCEVPSVNPDSRNVFMRRVKGVPAGNPPPNKRFVVNENFYSFGPILNFKKAEWKALADKPFEELNEEEQVQLAYIQATSTDVVRVTNNGRFKCNVDMGLEHVPENEAHKNTFIVEPSTLELEEGETKDVRLWAFPPEIGEFKNTLLMCVQDNAEPIRYDLKCWGVEPTIDLDGPWTEAIRIAEEELAACEDKKLMKEFEDKVTALKETFTFDFDRQLINKTEFKTFTVKNSSLLPVSWNIDLGDFADSENIVISPDQGVIPVGGMIEISVSFTSPEPLVLEGGFSLKFSDNENGLQNADRVGVRNFKVKTEAYHIQSVALNAEGQEDGGESIDYGILRVGDYASQVVKIANKGKYQIGYKFIITKPSMAALVEIDSMEGTIETGDTQAEIKLTFCSKQGEIMLKGNKDIKIQISEPLSGEVVETFPLYISADARYNKFRLQPSKGVSFGAARFDADPKTKRVELRNESKFDFTYVVCAKSLETDELDELDGPALGAYAYATPTASREHELGESFKERIGGGGAAAAAKGKGKGAPAGGPSEYSMNVLVHDPDDLQAGTVPEDPLVVGAFTVHPRIARVAPGETVGIDMTFDPKGCDVAREKLRICISGIDPNEGPSMVIRSFEVSGESCFPAITINSSQSIFEEQEVVEAISESAPFGKVEKLPVGKVVYAETENILAFGPIMCNNNANAKGTMERIRITNPTKIDTKVNFKIGSADRSGGGAAAAPAKGKGAPPPTEESVGGAFTVHPEMWEIPPHEHRFVNIYFNPTEIKSYRAIFEADVDYEGSDSTAGPKASGMGKKMTFDLGGSGTLPCIAIDYPTERSEDGSLGINFGRTHINRTSKRKFTIRNDGVMPATCLFDMTGDNDFTFPYSSSSLTIEPGGKKDMIITFSPTKVYEEGTRNCQIKTTVLNNQFDQYVFKMGATAYACDAMIDVGKDEKKVEEIEFDEDGNEVIRDEDPLKGTDEDSITITELNITEGSASSSRTIKVQSRSQHPIKFEMKSGDDVPNVLSYSPCIGHLGPNGSREVTVTFTATVPVKLESAPISCSLTRIEYKPDPNIPIEEIKQEDQDAEEELWGRWDDSMKNQRVATEEDLAQIKACDEAMAVYLELKAAEEAKGKKGKDPGPPPVEAICPLKVAEGLDDDGNQLIDIVINEPYSEVVEDAEVQSLKVSVSAVADVAKYSCQYEGENIPFTPTFLFQSTVHSFTFTNECNITLPVTWSFDDIKRRTATARTAHTSQTARTSMTRMGTAAANTAIPCPFFVDPEDCEIGPMQTKTFNLKFQPLDADDFVYALKGLTIASPAPAEEAEAEGEATEGLPALRGPMRMVLRGTAKRPVCHFEMQESPDYLAGRLPNMKNEHGLFAPIEATDLRVVELESTGLRTRNTFRFHIINPTAENYEFKWESIGDPSASWRCVQSAGMLFAGKRIEIVFEYLPEETSVAESFFKFRLPLAGLEQVFLFSGKVVEPKVFFSAPKLDFHSVMLGGQGHNEVIYLENQEHLPFNFHFDKLSLIQLEGTNGAVFDVSPKQGTVAPHGKVAISILFKPQDEVVYNYNIVLDVKRKPNKLNINVKGEGYAVHPSLLIEQNEEQIQSSASDSRFVALKPRPAVNYADFGTVKVYDTTSKTLTVTNNGKYNFDYLWDIENIGSMLALGGGKLGGTLHKGEEMAYTVTFAPQREATLDGSMMSFTVAGKYTYDIYARGVAQSPALRFSFMQYDFGPCFVTSPGGQTVIEEAFLRLVNHDPNSNISVECNFTKTRALWVECPPTVLEPGGMLDVPIRFAPRDVKDYTFVIPFVVNATSHVNVNVTGKGINARLELANATQRRTAFGIMNVGTESRKVIPIVNRSKKALAVQIVEESEFGESAFESKCITIFPRSEFVIAPRETVNLQVGFAPNRRISNFSEDVMVKYAGVTRKLISLSGKGQGVEVALDTDSLPFGSVVTNSSKVQKLGLENSGDIAITYSWQEATFGQNFSITPLSGKLQPNSETAFDVVFHPNDIDDDIRQDNITLMVPGLTPLTLTATGACIDQPQDATQVLQFNSIARKKEEKSITFTNPTDKDWYLTPSLQGGDWIIQNEVKVPAKGKADCTVTYYPLTMRPDPGTPPGQGEEDTAHQGKLFVALPDGTAQLYTLRGYAGPPDCSGTLELETTAKKAATTTVKLNNWLSETQKLKVTVDLTEKPSEATFIVAANAVEVNPNGSKEFPIRFISYTEGTAKGTVTFTNPITGEYSFYEFIGKATMPEVLEDVSMESCVRQSAKYVISLENPLPPDAEIDMDCHTDDSWWSCDSEDIRVKELTPLNGNPEGSFEVEYRPLAPTDSNKPTEHLLSIKCKSLGTYKYKLVVTATKPPLPQSLKFEVPLGSVQSESFLFKAFNKGKTDYSCSLKNADLFTVDKTKSVDAVSTWEGEDIRVAVTFEPVQIGEVTDTLTITAPGGVEYISEVTASCVPAMPQGPFIMAQGASSDIPFRNYFSSAENWTFAVDSPHFKVGAASAQVPAKTEGKASVSFSPEEGHGISDGGTLSAKMFVTCTGKPDLAPFVFYIKGLVGAADAAPAGKKK